MRADLICCGFPSCPTNLQRGCSCDLNPLPICVEGNSLQGFPSTQGEILQLQSSNEKGAISGWENVIGRKRRSADVRSGVESSRPAVRARAPKPSPVTADIGSLGLATGCPICLRIGAPAQSANRQLGETLSTTRRTTPSIIVQDMRPPTIQMKKHVRLE